MKTKTLIVAMCCLLSAVIALGGAPAQQQGGQGGQRGQRGQAEGQGQRGQQAARPQETLPRNVTVTAIPGVIAAGAKWQQVWQGADNADGIVGLNDGNVLFAQEQPGIIRKLDRNDYDSAYVKDTHGTGSISIDAQGRIIGVQRACTDPGRGDAPCTGNPAVAIIYPEKDRKVLADNFQGKPLGRLNDLVVHKNGTVYFNGGGTFYVKPGGQVTQIGDNIGSNGIMLSPDEKTLYMTNGATLLAFEVKADGTPGNQREFGMLRDGGRGDGLAVDAAGRLYVTAQSAGVQVFAADGNYLGTIPTPRDVITVAFGGPDKKMLYVVGSGALAPNGKEFTLAEGFRNNAKTIYKIPMLAEGFKGRVK